MAFTKGLGIVADTLFWAAAARLGEVSKRDADVAPTNSCFGADAERTGSLPLFVVGDDGPLSGQAQLDWSTKYTGSLP